MARRSAPGRNRVPARRRPAPPRPAESAPPARPPATGRGARQAQAGFLFGVLAMLVLPAAYQWTLRPSTNPFGSTGPVLVVEAAGIVAAAVALLLGRRARAAGDRSNQAVWAPRLGAAAMVGYVMTLVLILSRGG